MELKACLPARHTLALLLTLLTLGGCSLLQGPWHPKPAPPAPLPAPPAVAAPPSLPLAEATHRFIVSDSLEVVGQVQTTVAAKEDTLPDIARRFDIGYEEIVRANPGVDPWLPGAGRRIVLPTQFVLPSAAREGIVINLAAMRVYYFPKHAKGEPQLMYTHPIGIGRVGWQTPEGVTKVIAKKEDPVWRPSAAVRKEHEDNGDPVDAVVPAGPDNPLGKYEFVLGWPSYLIHGTNKPYGVGLRSSHGCIRLYPEDIEKVFHMVPIGTPVRVVNQPFLFGWRNEQLYLQAYTVLEDDPRDWTKAQHSLLAKSLTAKMKQILAQRHEQLDWDAVSHVAHQPRGVPVAVSGQVESLDGVLAAAPEVQNHIPHGSNWAGDEAGADAVEFQHVLSEREPQKPAPRPGG